MSEGFLSRGFHGRRQQSELSGRLPPGQYLERGFPALSAGPTPHTPLANWDFSIVGEVDQPRRWTWEGVSLEGEHPPFGQVPPRARSVPSVDVPGQSPRYGVQEKTSPDTVASGASYRRRG
jgi:hypothetical protein